MITLFIPYFGAFPNYFQAYLDSLGANTGTLEVVMITDISFDSYRVPPNLIKYVMTFDELRACVHAFLLKTFGKSPPAAELIMTPYKLVDFKVTYPLLFEDLYKPDINSFVGWGDIDVIYGDLSKFVTGSYDIIGGWHGHFTAIKNTHLFKSLFLTIPDYYKLATDNSKTYITDEIAYREPLVNFIKTHDLKMCYLNASFCDVLPPCFYHLSRPEHAKYAKNFFNNLKPAKNITYLKYKAGSLQTVYDDGEVQETSYVHLQKRKMSYEKVEDTYWITDTAFVTEEPEEERVIPANLFMTWHTKELPGPMQVNVDRIIAANPDIKVQIFDDAECATFLTANFPPEVVAAFHSLRPGAYKADLWRYCVLYIYGGIYMDIKLRPTDDFRLSSLLVREQFTNDGVYTQDGKKHYSVYNGLMSCKKESPILLKAIVQIIVNVSRKYYGPTQWSITGPRLLAALYEASSDIEPLYYVHFGPSTNQTIKLNNKNVFTEYDGYRSDIHSNYSSLWTSRQVYEGELVLNVNTWPSNMLKIYDDICSAKKIRLHMPAIPYTITRDEYSHDAYTGKVQRFGPMMRTCKGPNRGGSEGSEDSEQVFEVFHYGVETSESGADRDIQLMTKAEWHQLRIDSMQSLEKSLSREEAEAKVLDPTTIVSTLANWSTPLFHEFNRRFKEALKKTYRGVGTDIICVPLGHSYDEAIAGIDVVVVESGIGYNNSCKNFRVFESYSWMSRTLGAEDKSPNNYWFVVPNYYNTKEFVVPVIEPLRLQGRPKVGFLGRVIREKGCYVIAEIAKRFPNVDFVLCGQGNAAQFLTSPNISYKMPIHGSERSEYLGSCVATICASTYLEPFGGSNVESQLCGTPVIAIDNGAFVETVEQFKTGLRCHTLADFCKGVQMALDGAFDRAYIRERAVRLYGMENVAKQYEYVFKSVLDIRNGKNGWYSTDCHLVTP